MPAILAEVVALRMRCEDQAALFETNVAASVQAEVGVQLDALMAENAQLLRTKADLEQRNETLGQACALSRTILSWESDDSYSETRDRFVHENISQQSAAKSGCGS